MPLFANEKELVVGVEQWEDQVSESGTEVEVEITKKKEPYMVQKAISGS